MAPPLGALVHQAVSCHQLSALWDIQHPVADVFTVSLARGVLGLLALAQGATPRLRMGGDVSHSLYGLP